MEQNPHVDELLALVKRLAAADLDSALELSRLLTAACQAGELAEHMVKSGRAPAALAWLRRITREVDTLQVAWQRAHARPVVPTERRACNGPSAADASASALCSGPAGHDAELPEAPPVGHADLRGVRSPQPAPLP